MIFNIFRVVLTIAEVLLIFNLLIIVHELGHFLAARWRGLQVDKFGIWFGRPIWKRNIKGVEYSLGWIPAGGFVLLPQMAPMESVEGKSETAREDLSPVSPLDKIIVAFAGPFFSFLLALVFAVIVWAVGKPTAEADATTTVGYVAPGEPAAKAGFKPGDVILEVDNHPVSRFSGMVDSITWYVVRSEGETIPFKIRRGDKILTLISSYTRPETRGWERRSLRQVGIAPAITPIVFKVAEGSVAAQAGIRPNDRDHHGWGPEVLPSPASSGMGTGESGKAIAPDSIAGWKNDRSHDGAVAAFGIRGHQEQPCGCCRYPGRRSHSGFG